MFLCLCRLGLPRTSTNCPPGSLWAPLPTRVLLSLQMESPGLVVLADLWDNGWEAYLNGKRLPILRTSHALAYGRNFFLDILLELVDNLPRRTWRHARGVAL